MSALITPGAESATPGPKVRRKNTNLAKQGSNIAANAFIVPEQFAAKGETPLGGLDIFVPSNDEPFTLSDGKRCLYFGASFAIFMSRPLMDALLAAVGEVQMWEDENISIEDQDHNPLEWVPASALKPLKTHSRVEMYDHHRAVWAYLGALPDEHPVGLAWAF